jgi:hypothetical protein
MQFPDMVHSCVEKAKLAVDPDGLAAVKGEIFGNEGKWLARPWTHLKGWGHMHIGHG